MKSNRSIRFSWTRRITACLAACVFVLSVCIPIAKAEGTAEQGGHVLLERMASAYESAGRLQAEFSLDTEFLANNHHSGTVSLDRPCCLRVVFDAPQRKIFLANRDAQYEYLPDENKAYRYRTDTNFRPSEAYGLYLQMRQFLAYIRPVGAEPLEDGLMRVRLVPVDSIPQVSEIKLDIEETSGMLRRAVVLNDKGDELLRLSLDGYAMPEEWPASHFEPPADARIYTPMVERDFLNSDR